MRIFDTARHPRLAERIGQALATLVFDSFARPQLAGIRSTETANRQLLYRAGDYSIDLQIAPSTGARGDLIGQVLLTSRQRLATLQGYYPRARAQDWRLEVAGQRVQIIKPDARRTGVLEFGTELVPASDRSLVALLGASPGASTAVWIAIEVLERPNHVQLGLDQM